MKRLLVGSGQAYPCTATGATTQHGQTDRQTDRGREGGREGGLIFASSTQVERDAQTDKQRAGESWLIRVRVRVRVSWLIRKERKHVWKCVILDL